jgi:hypothetical protein
LDPYRTAPSAAVPRAALGYSGIDLSGSGQWYYKISLRALLIKYQSFAKGQRGERGVKKKNILIDHYLHNDRHLYKRSPFVLKLYPLSVISQEFG